MNVVGCGFIAINVNIFTSMQLYGSLSSLYGGCLKGNTCIYAFLLRLKGKTSNLHPLPPDANVCTH